MKVQGLCKPQGGESAGRAHSTPRHRACSSSMWGWGSEQEERVERAQDKTSVSTLDFSYINVVASRGGAEVGQEEANCGQILRGPVFT